jgi:hypothetical protein
MVSWVLQRLDELHQWFVALDRPFAFLLALPFIIALAAFGAELVRQRRARLPSQQPRVNGGRG